MSILSGAAFFGGMFMKERGYMVSKQQDDIKAMQMLHLRIDDIQEIILQVRVLVYADRLSWEGRAGARAVDFCDCRVLVVVSFAAAWAAPLCRSLNRSARTDWKDSLRRSSAWRFATRSAASSRRTT